MKSINYRWKVLILVLHLVVAMPRLHAQEIELKNIQKQQKLTFGFSKFIDSSQNLNIDYIRKTATFVSTKQSIPDFDWSKYRGWVKFNIRNNKTQELWVQIHNPLLSEFDFFVFKADSCLVHDRFSLKNRSKNQFPTFCFKSVADQTYTIYLAAKAELNPIKFPIRVLTDEGINDLEVNKSFELGLLIGFSGLLIFLNGLIGIVFRIRLFWILGLFIFNFSGLYAFQEGNLTYLYQQSHFNFQYLIFAIVFFLNLTFVWALFRVYLSTNIYWRNTYTGILICATLLFLFMLFSPLWYYSTSNAFIKSLAYGVRFISIFSNIFMLVAAFRLYAKVNIAKWYLLGILPGMLSYAIPRFFKSLLDGVWLTLPQIYFLTVIWFTITMSIGFIILLAQNYTKIEVKEVIIEDEKEITQNTASITTTSVLSKREIEIIKAFSNGFTYQEISDALFISPHTVRTHLKNIYQKLEINSKAEAVKYVIENNL